MRLFNRLHRVGFGAVSATAIGALIVQSLLAQPPGTLPDESASTADPIVAGEASDATKEPMEDSASRRREPVTYLLLTGDGQVEQFSANRIYAYSMAPGAARPKRLANSGQAVMGMSDMSGMSSMGGMPAMEGMGTGGMGSPYPTTESKRWPTMYALVVDEAEGEEPYYLRRMVAPIQVVVRAAEHAGEMNGAAMGVSEGQDISGYGMEASMEPAGTFVPLDAKDDEGAAYLPKVLRSLTSKERFNLAQLVRIDVWIEDDCRALRTNRDDSKLSRTIEARLRERLDQEYDTLLAKQQSDAERLRERLERLEADLERRAKAKQRVVDVQLSKMVLEAQGLLDSQR